MPTLDSLARYPLATLPTPLDELPRLSRELGVRVLMKRDDLTGFALGGNKARKLEFLVADALAQHADMLVTGGGPQSNHARMTAAAARKVGMKALLLLSGNPPSDVNGNLLLDVILGAEIRYLPSPDFLEADRVIERTAQQLRDQGRRAYPIPVGGSTVLGACSYILATGELLAQLDVKPDYIFITTGSCGTHAGILAGVKYYNAKIPVYGITVSRPREQCLSRLASLVERTSEFLGQPLPLEPGDIIVNDDYLGASYGAPTRECHAAMRLVARLEGIFLDPVYTGKTMAGMIDLVHRGVIAPGATVVFWHTGGVPGLFGHAQDFVGAE